MARYLVLDEDDQTYSAGGGDWTPDRDKALRLPSIEAAHRHIEDVDQLRLLNLSVFFDLRKRGPTGRLACDEVFAIGEGPL